MVSTSGSSGTDVYVYESVFDLYGECRDLHRSGVIVMARAAIEFPGVPRTRDVMAVKRAVAQPPGGMWTRAINRVHGSVHVAHGIRMALEFDFGDAAGRNPAEGPHPDE